MKDMGIVQGSIESAVPLIVGKTTVYVHEDIEQVTNENKQEKEIEELYQYHEYQYSLQEYIELQTSKREELEEAVDDILTNIIPDIMEVSSNG